MKKSKAFYITLSVILFFIIVAIILGTIYDLQISKALADVDGSSYHSKNIFAILGETFGENILYILLECSFAIIFFYLIKNPLNKKWLNVLLIIFFVIAGCIVSFYCIHKTLNYISIYTSFGLDTFISSTIGLISVVVFSCVVSAITFLLFSKVKNETLHELVGWALAVLIISLISNAIVQGAKLIFDRTRYRAMVYEGYNNFEYFTYWFQINSNKFASVSPFVSDYFESFPSGHTCAAASSFLLVLLPTFYKKTDTYAWKFFFIAFACIYTFLVGFSRIIAGAHFFTDVLFGGLIAIACVLIAKWFVIEKILLKNKIKQQEKLKLQLETESKLQKNKKSK